MSLRKLVLQLGVGVLGLYLAVRFVPEIELTKGIKTLILAGLVLGFLNYFIKPVLKTISLPLRILTLGLFSFVINMGLIWAVDIIFPDLIIKGLLPLFWTALIIWGLGLLLPLLIPKKKTVPVNE